MQKTPSYQYFKGSDINTYGSQVKTEGAIALGIERSEPSLKNPDYLVLIERKRIISKWIEILKKDELDVLDVGGRTQPYRPLLRRKIKKYVAIDPLVTGLLDAIAVGEKIPFKDQSFDLVICTQMLGYASNPFKVISEIFRVLKPGAALILTVPAFFPSHHDERWRFLPEGLQKLMSSFTSVKIEPEGYSISGLFRTISVCLNFYSNKRILGKIIKSILIPANNICGKTLDRFSRKDERLTANYSALAIK